MLALSISSLSSLSGCAQIFICLFLFRYTRLLANIVGYLIYKPTPIPDNPVLTSEDVTVIVATVDPFNPDFAECIKSIAATSPATLIIVTAGGQQNFHEAARYRQIIPKAHILVISSSKVDVCTLQILAVLPVQLAAAKVMEKHKQALRLAGQAISSRCTQLKRKEPTLTQALRTETPSNHPWSPPRPHVHHHARRRPCLLASSIPLSRPRTLPQPVRWCRWHC